ADAPRSRAALASGTARMGGADGMRLRRVLRVRDRDRRATETPLRRRSGALYAPGRCQGGGMILNASGCLDALLAPDTTRLLDAFVTKTVTPLPRDGNPPVRIAETDV